MRYHSSMESELLAESGFADASDGTRIHWSAVGRGSPALVCCDGIGCDGFAWEYLGRDFAPRPPGRPRALRGPSRGRARSALPEAPSRVGFDDVSSDLQAVLEATGTPQAVLLGHS